MGSPVETVIEKVQPPQGVAPVYSPSAIVLYGVPVTGVQTVVGINPQGAVVAFMQVIAGKSYTTALVYGFAYQGHCYNLPEPIIVLVENRQGWPQQAVGCDYDLGNNLNYLMWEVDKSEMTAQFQLTNDTFEELILKRNIGGSKQPMAYHSAAQLAHRGGKLVE